MLEPRSTSGVQIGTSSIGFEITWSEIFFSLRLQFLCCASPQSQYCKVSPIWSIFCEEVSLSLWQVSTGTPILSFICVVCQVCLPVWLGRHIFFLLHNITALLTIVSLYKMDISSFTSTPSIFDLSMSDEQEKDSSGPKGPTAESEGKAKTACAVSQ